MSKKELVLNALNTDGTPITITELSKKTGINKRVLGSIIYHLRKKGHNISFAAGVGYKYMDKTQQNPTTKRSNTSKNLLEHLRKASPAGVTRKDLIKNLGITQTSLFCAIHHLRKKFKITTNKDSYILKGELGSSQEVQKRLNETPVSFKGTLPEDLFKDITIEQIRRLSPEGKENLYGFMRHEIVSHICSRAYIEADNVVNAIIQKVERE